MSQDTLSRAKSKADPRRFTGEPPTGYGPLGPDDSLVARIESIWGLTPRDVCPPEEADAEMARRAEMAEHGELPWYLGGADK